MACRCIDAGTSCPCVQLYMLVTGIRALSEPTNSHGSLASSVHVWLQELATGVTMVVGVSCRALGWYLACGHPQLTKVAVSADPGLQGEGQRREQGGTQAAVKTCG